MSRGNTKLGVTVTAKDQATSDLERVAKEFLKTGGAAAQANKEVSNLERETAETIERERLKAFVAAEAARGADLRGIKAMHDKAVTVALEADGEAARSAARTARMIKREWLSSVAKIEAARIKAAKDAAEAEKKAQAARVDAANQHDDSGVARSTSAFGRLREAIGLANSEASDIVPMKNLGGVVGKLGPYARGAGIAFTAAAAGIAATVAAGVIATREISDLAESTARAVHEQTLLAARATTNVETLSRFGYAAQTVGADLDDAQDAMSELGQRAVNMPQDFERWDIATKNTNHTLKTTQQLLFGLADRLQETQSETERLALADELMGDVGRRLLPVLEQGSEGLRLYFEEADRLGATIDSTSAIIAERFVRQLEDAETATGAVTRTVGTAFQPAVTEAFGAAERVATRVLERINDNEESFTDFATGSVALLARGFALLVETGSALSHVAEGIVSVFTFRLGPAFDEARSLAAEVAQEARFLAGDLERGAEITRNEVVPAVDDERAARAKLVKTLSGEKKAREDLRGAAGDALGDLLDAKKTAEILGQSQREDAQEVAKAILTQVSNLDSLEARLRSTSSSAADLSRALVEGGPEAMRQVEAQTEARRSALRAQISLTKKGLEGSAEAAQELTKIIIEELRKQKAAEEAQMAAGSKALREREKAFKEQGRAEAEARREATRAAAQEWDSYARSFEQAGMTIVGSLRQAYESVKSGSKNAGEAALSVLGSVANAALNAAIAYGVQQAAIAATNALLGTQAAVAATTTATQTSGAATAAAAQTTGAGVATGAAKVAAFSQITAAAAKAGAEAFAAYAGIPVVGPALGAAAAAEAVAQTMAFATMLAFNKGGLVPGTGNTDSVPAWLTPGELVIPKEVTQALLGAGQAGPSAPTAIIQPQLMLPTMRVDFDRLARESLRIALERAGWRVA